MNQQSDRIFPILLTGLAVVNYGLLSGLDRMFAFAMGTDGYDNYSAALATLAVLSTVATFGTRSAVVT